jgi:hypothetical protein
MYNNTIILNGGLKIPTHHIYYGSMKFGKLQRPQSYNNTRFQFETIFMQAYTHDTWHLLSLPSTSFMSRGPYRIESPGWDKRKDSAWRTWKIFFPLVLVTLPHACHGPTHNDRSTAQNSKLWSLDPPPKQLLHFNSFYRAFNVNVAKSCQSLSVNLKESGYSPGCRLPSERNSGLV